MNTNQSQITKRSARCFTRAMKNSGALRAGTLGDLQDDKPGKFLRSPWGRHEHSWIPGTDIEVCTQCGTTRPKTK